MRKLITLLTLLVSLGTVAGGNELDKFQRSNTAQGTDLIQVVPTNALTPIKLSNRSVNDVMCKNGKAIDFYKSSNVPAIIQKIPDSSGWIVTFQTMVNEMNPSDIRYFSEPVEIYFICSTGNYKTTILPEYGPSRTVILGTGAEGALTSNQDLVRGRDIEEVAVELALNVMKDQDLPDSFTIKHADRTKYKWHKNIVAGVSLRPVRTVQVDGVGLRANEYDVLALADIQQLHHTQFLVTPLGGNIFTVTLKDQQLRKGQQSTVVITHLERGI